MHKPHELIDAYLDGTIDEAGLAELREWLIADPANADAFANRSLLHRHAYELHGSPAESKPAPSAATLRMPSEPKTPSLEIRWALAAAMLLSAAVVAAYVFVINPKPEVGIGKPNPPIATLIDATGDVFVNNDFANPGSDYARGTYATKSGSAQFLLANRVTVDLRGKTRLQLHHTRSVDLASGSAAFNVPHDVTGFTVHLPDRSRIVDLGTAFSVEVDDDGRTTLRVREGLVEWRPSDAAAAPVRVAAGSIARLVDGLPVVEPKPELAIASYATDVPETMTYARLEPGSTRIDRYLDAQIDEVPPALADLPAIVPPRGPGSAQPGAGYAFTLTRPARLYLLVHDRGGYAPDGWQPTGDTVAWTVLDQSHVDTVYTRIAQPGEVVIPEHRGRSGTQYGVPHVCLIAPIPEPVEEPASDAHGPENGPLKGAPK